MRNSKSIAGLVAIAFIFLAINALETSAQIASNVRPIQFAEGTKQKIQGVVSVRSGDAFKVRTLRRETTVLLTSPTDVTSHSRGLRGKKE